MAFDTLQSQIDVVKAKINALTADTMTAEEILYVSQTLQTLADSLGVDDIVAATANAISQIDQAAADTITVVEGTANGQAVADLQAAYDTLQTTYDILEPRLGSIESTITNQESAIATATTIANDIRLNPWQFIINDYSAFDKDRLFVNTRANFAESTVTTQNIAGLGLSLYDGITFDSDQQLEVDDRIVLIQSGSLINGIELIITSIEDPAITGSATFGAVSEYGIFVDPADRPNFEAWVDEYNLEGGTVGTFESVSYTLKEPITTNINISLPIGPTVGARVEIVDVSGRASNIPFNVLRVGQLIQGQQDDLVFNIDNGAIVLVYAGYSYGWRIVNA